MKKIALEGNDDIKIVAGDTGAIDGCIADALELRICSAGIS